MRSTMSTTAASETLEALYNINKHARKYADLGTKNYRDGKKTTAKANSNKKKALYAVKTRVLAELIDTASRIELHEIDGDAFYCVYFDRWSFHTPVEQLDIDDEVIESRKTLDGFAKNSEKEFSEKSLKECLLHIESEFGINANDHLPDQYLWYGHDRYFIGWPYLRDA